MIDPTTYQRFRFFRTHAGFIVGERAKGALQLAKAEQRATTIGITFEWIPDDTADWSWMSDAELQRDHEAYGCIATRPRPCHACGHDNRDDATSLWGIFDPDPTYMRVVEAELALELLHE